MKLGSFTTIAWLGITALAACGSEAGPPSSETPAEPAVATASEPPKAPAPPPASPAEPAPVAIPKLGAPYPVVLLHGAAGWGTIGAGPIEITYFNGIREDLADHGEPEVFVTVAPPYASSETRAKVIAKQLDDILDRTNRAKVNLVAHSQGGLDARVLASPNGLGYGDRIASVTTISTPHRGTRIADATMASVGLLPSQLDPVVNGFLGLLQRTVYDLETDAELSAQVTQMTEKNMRDIFNAKYVDDARVKYASYAGRTNMRVGVFDCEGSTYPNPTGIDVTQPAFAASAVFLEEGFSLKVNDGMVTVESAKWGEFEQCVPADHLKEVGHFGVAATFDQKAFFRDVVGRIRQSGL